jgi:hypothetical protein
MAGVYSELRGFALAHRVCGELRGDAEPLTPEGYRLGKCVSSPRW